ncbi:MULTISPECIES: hypothetical protein [unclassified Acinetobacter]|uniref:hypothetical protein n=1 Tax=unclassified Acinetobacter TaxID=196816 RepID=UPI002934D2A4|nr:MULTISPECIES: hypothetical protein [unclassified Acinetobacter]WOE32203.1 hypothetical protein QSG84_03030 [Acinetobacter sp. SAAs470]WOE37673.1 hypothetical protein QSG86_12075 [Acinetobacter sp. SAAs474]
MEGIKKGQLDWTGDNPFIYLKTNAQQDWSSLSLYFRIASSDYGAGNAVLVLENPYEKDAANLHRFILTDNLVLARYLVENFVRYFTLFRKAVALDAIRYIDDACFITENYFPQQHIENIYSPSQQLTVDLI